MHGLKEKLREIYSRGGGGSSRRSGLLSHSGQQSSSASRRTVSQSLRSPSQSQSQSPSQSPSQLQQKGRRHETQQQQQQRRRRRKQQQQQSHSQQNSLPSLRPHHQPQDLPSVVDISSITITKREAFVITNKGRKLIIDEANGLLTKLERIIRGKIILPCDKEYSAVTTIWNQRIGNGDHELQAVGKRDNKNIDYSTRPGLIIQCKGAADVTSCVQFASRYKLKVSVRSTGHNIDGKCFCEGAMCIDLSQIKYTHINPKTKVLSCGAGTTVGEIDYETKEFGLALPMASTAGTGIHCSNTGISGLTLGCGGSSTGIGWLTRKFGLTCDSLLGANVVCADGTQKYCDKETNADLFWAIRGGGGNFGIATDFTFQLFDCGPEIISGPIIYSIREARQVIEGFLKLSRTNNPKKDCDDTRADDDVDGRGIDDDPGVDGETNCDENLQVTLLLRQSPPFPFILAEYHYRPVVMIMASYLGQDMDAANAAIEPYRTLATNDESGLIIPPIGEAFCPRTLVSWNQVFEELYASRGRYFMETCHFNIDHLLPNHRSSQNCSNHDNNNDSDNNNNNDDDDKDKDNDNDNHNDINSRKNFVNTNATKKTLIYLDDSTCNSDDSRDGANTCKNNISNISDDNNTSVNAAVEPNRTLAAVAEAKATTMTLVDLDDSIIDSLIEIDSDDSTVNEAYVQYNNNNTSNKDSNRNAIKGNDDGDNEFIDILIQWGKRPINFFSEIVLFSLGDITTNSPYPYLYVDNGEKKENKVDLVINIHTRWVKSEDDAINMNWCRNFRHKIFPYIHRGDAAASFQTDDRILHKLHSDDKSKKNDNGAAAKAKAASGMNQSVDENIDEGNADVGVDAISYNDSLGRLYYGETNLNRLNTIKTKYDPDNFFFSVNYNIHPRFLF